MTEAQEKQALYPRPPNALALRPKRVSSARESGNANTLRASAEVDAALMDFQYKNNDFDFSGIRLGISAGEALPASLRERFSKRFGFEILDGIGSTEALYIFMSNSPGDVRHGPPDAQFRAAN
jgi:acyl-coenzyme A synthetase/AMP-(fatty) acid ligase